MPIMKKTFSLCLFLMISVILTAQQVAETADFYFQEGINSGVEGDFKTATEHFSKAIEKRSSFAEAYLFRGLARTETGDFEQAVKDLTICMELDPNFSDQAYYFMGNAKSGMKKYKEAIDDYTLAIYKNPDYLAFFKRGMANFHQNEFHRAIPDFDICIRLQPLYHEAYLYRGIALYQIGSMPDARQDLEKATNALPDNAQAFYYSGLTKSAMQNNYFAIEDFNKAIELDPAFSDAYRSRGVSQEKVGNKDQARQDYQLASQSKPITDVQQTNTPTQTSSSGQGTTEKTPEKQQETQASQTPVVEQTALFPARKTQSHSTEVSKNPSQSAFESAATKPSTSITQPSQAVASTTSLNTSSAASTLETLPGGYYSTSLAPVSPVGFGIQLASYSSTKNIQELADAYQQQHHQIAYIQTSLVNGRKLYKIIMGSFATRSEAETFRNQLRQNGFPDCFIVAFEKY